MINVPEHIKTPRVGLPKMVPGKQALKLFEKTASKKTSLTAPFFRTVFLENSIVCRAANYNPEKTLTIFKRPSQQQYFILKFDEVSAHDEIVNIKKGAIKQGAQKIKTVTFVESFDDLDFIIPQRSQIKCVENLIPKKWFLHNLQVNFTTDILRKYISSGKLQSDANLFLQRCSQHFLKISDGLFKDIPDNIFLQKKVSSFIKLFQSGIDTQITSFTEMEKVRVSKDDIAKLLVVKKRLDKATTPPTFQSLTITALMSGTSLKTKFKKMYGITTFEYFQSIRMQRARILLLTHKYSVTQIGLQLGYSNLSNFTIAFKKQFNLLPRDIVKGS